jgi:hypothetical protein
VTQPDRSPLAVESSTYGSEEERGFGWMMFAATMLGLVSVLNIIDGIAAISNSQLSPIRIRSG